MKILELFAGSRSIGKVGEKLGHEVFSSDMDKKRLTRAKPPKYIYEECRKRFKVSFELGTVFTYGENIHSVAEMMSDDLYIHELTHVAQQKEIGADLWWKQYLADDKFRLEQETEAYLNQWIFALNNYNSSHRKKLRKHIVESLSGHMYGNIISSEEVSEMLYAKERGQ